MAITFLTGDCRDILPTLADASVQCVVTSPPYYALRSYLHAEHRDKHREIGLEPTPDAFVATLVAVFREVRRVLRDDGTVWMNLGDSYATSVNGLSAADKNAIGDDTRVFHDKPFSTVGNGYKAKDLMMMPARVALALQADGWWLRSDIIWAKPNPMPESCRDRPTSAHEHVFLLTKKPRYYFDSDSVREDVTGNQHAGRSDGGISAPRGGGVDTGGARPSMPTGLVTSRNCRNVWTIATEAYPQAHFATFPTALAERCIRAGTSERGACSACGAPWVRIVEKSGGTTGKAWNNHENDLQRGQRGGDNGHNAAAAGWKDYRVEMLGWSASCTCNADVVPCTVLDPFSGAGTTALVADRLQRNAIAIDLSHEYRDMAAARYQADAGMFADTGTATLDESYDRDMRDLFAYAAD